ncbi:MAG: trypsin-like peptidase domain-containing protein [Armatimonadota bacterium]|nr:trypsin-like peptidase domain-containing protein [Armatimonadota bacterium]
MRISRTVRTVWSLILMGLVAIQFVNADPQNPIKLYGNARKPPERPVYAGDHLVFTVALPSARRRVAEIFCDKSVVARTFVMEDVGYFGFRVPPSWGPNTMHEIRLGRSGRPIAWLQFYKGSRPGWAVAGGDPEKEFQAAVRLASAGAATVRIEALTKSESATGGEAGGDGRPLRVAEEGSGIIVSREGLVITCDHVVRGADTIRVEYQGNEYEARRKSGTVADKWAQSDVAILQIKRRSPSEEFVTAYLATPDIVKSAVKSGSEAQSVGYPVQWRTLRTIKGLIAGFGAEPARTSGPVEGTIDARLGPVYMYPSPILVDWEEPIEETEATGMSGGPLVTPAGHVIGILQSTRLSSSQYIPVPLICKAVEDIEAGPSPARKAASKVFKLLPVIPMRNWEQAEQRDAAWPKILKGLSLIPTGRIGDAANLFIGAIRAAKTPSATQTAVAGLERLCPHSAPAIANAVTSALNDDVKIPPEPLAELLALASRHDCLPRSTLVSALDANEAVIRQAALAALSDLGTLDRLTHEEFECMARLFGEPEAAPAAGYAMACLLYTPDYTEKSGSDHGLRRAAEEMIRSNLLNGEFSVRKAIAQAIKEKDDPAAITESLMADLRVAQNNSGQWRVVETLGLIGSKEAVQPLLSVLRQSPEQTNDRGAAHNSAALALGKIGTKEAIDGLKNVLKSEQSGSAVSALARTGGKDAVEALKEACLRDTTDDSVQRPHIIEQLARMGGKSAEDALIAIVEAPDSQGHAISIAAGLRKAQVKASDYPALTEALRRNGYRDIFPPEAAKPPSPRTPRQKTMKR